MVSRRRRGLTTALCSMDEMRTFIPGLRYPLNTTLRDSVTLAVKFTYLASPSHPPKNDARRSRQEKTRSSVPMSRFDALPRARFAPHPVRKSDMALATHSGLGHVVAPLFM